MYKLKLRTNFYIDFLKNVFNIFKENTAKKILDNIDDGFKYVPSMRVEGACASGGLAVMAAMDWLKAGSADITLVAGIECQTTWNWKDGAKYLARAWDYHRQVDIDDFIFPCLYFAFCNAHLNCID